MTNQRFNKNFHVGAQLAFVFMCSGLLLNVFASDLTQETTIQKNTPQNGVHSLSVHVSNIRPSRGSVRVSLYESPTGFPSNPSYAAQRSVFLAETSSTTVHFENIIATSCAVSILQDLNNNGRLDKNMLGIPVEPIAVSNHAPLRWGPPSFHAAEVPLTDQHSSIVITLP